MKCRSEWAAFWFDEGVLGEETQGSSAGFFEDGSDP